MLGIIAMEVFLISGYIVAILLLAIALLLLILYNGKLQVSRDKKQDQINDLRDVIDAQRNQIGEMDENGRLLQERATQLFSYYEFADKFLREMFSAYSIYKQTGIDNILKHRYFGDDPTIQHFIQETLKYDKNIIIKMEEYNKNVQQIFTEKEEEK